MARPSPVPSPLGLVVKNGSVTAARIGRRDPGARVGDREHDLAGGRSAANDDVAAVAAGVAGVEQQVHERVLDQPRVAADRRQRRGAASRVSADAGLREPVLDQRHRAVDRVAGRDPLRAPAVAARQPQKARGSPRRCARTCARIASQAAARRARPPPRGRSCSARPAITPSGVAISCATPMASVPSAAMRLARCSRSSARLLQLGDGQLALQHQLFALLAHGEAAEREHQHGGDRPRRQSGAGRPRARDRARAGRSPPPRPASHPAAVRTRARPASAVRAGNPSRRCLRSGQPRHASPRANAASIGGAVDRLAASAGEPALAAAPHENDRPVGPGNGLDLGGQRRSRDAALGRDLQHRAQSPRDAGLLGAKIRQGARVLAIGVPAGEAGDGGDRNDHRPDQSSTSHSFHPQLEQGPRRPDTGAPRPFHVTNSGRTGRISRHS